MSEKDEKPPVGVPDEHDQTTRASREAHRVSESATSKTKIKENIELGDVSGSESSKMFAPEMESELQKNLKALEKRASGDSRSKDITELVVPRKKLLFITIQPRSLIRWSNKPLRDPLSKVTGDMARDALKAFSSIQRYMGDRPAGPEGKGDAVDIRFVADRGMCVVGLRNELYLQIYKQLNDNPSMTSVLKAWEVLCVMTNCFTPPQPLASIIQNYLLKHAIDQVKVDELLTDFKWKTLEGAVQEKARLGLMAKYCLQKFNHTMKTPKGRVPSVEEINHFVEAPFKYNVFGETLQNVVKNPQNVDEKTGLPKVLSFLAEAVLLLGGHNAEGIFRVPGDLDAVIRLRMRIERGEYNLEGIMDSAVPASLLKMWVRELEEPVIPNQFYTRCLEISQVQAAMDVVDQLPELNRRCMKYLAKYLQIVGDPANQPKTKMSVSNLAIVFAPNVLRCPSDNPLVILQNAKKEQRFVKIIVNYLDE